MSLPTNFFIGKGGGAFPATTLIYGSQSTDFTGSVNGGAFTYTLPAGVETLRVTAYGGAGWDGTNTKGSSTANVGSGGRGGGVQYVIAGNSYLEEGQQVLMYIASDTDYRFMGHAGSAYNGTSNIFNGTRYNTGGGATMVKHTNATLPTQVGGIAAGGGGGGDAGSDGLSNNHGGNGGWGGYLNNGAGQGGFGGYYNGNLSGSPQGYDGNTSSGGCGGIGYYSGAGGGGGMTWNGSGHGNGAPGDSCSYCGHPSRCPPNGSSYGGDYHKVYGLGSSSSAYTSYISSSNGIVNGAGQLYDSNSMAGGGGAGYYGGGQGCYGNGNGHAGAGGGGGGSNYVNTTNAAFSSENIKIGNWANHAGQVKLEINVI